MRIIDEIKSRLRNIDWVETAANIFGYSVLIAIWFGVGITVVRCMGGDKDEPKEQPKTEKVMWKKVYVPLPSETIRVEVPGKVDTVRVVQEYFTKQVVRDTVLRNDTVQLVVADTLWQNRIVERTVEVQVNPKVFRKDHGIALATSFGYRQADLMAQYQHKRWSAGAGWNFAEKSPVVSVGYKLFEW